jgi:alkylated DNA repair dioxygenase AlkB
MGLQGRLFSVAEPRVNARALAAARRYALGGAWIEHAPQCLLGDDVVFDHLAAGMTWSQPRRRMYDTEVDTPRLLASVPDDGPGHPVIALLVAALSARYGRPVDRVSLAWYRDGRDSVAMHGDRIGDQVDDSVVAIVSLRGPRRLLVRPRAGLPGPKLSFDLGHGDLLVMGGSCQRDFDHGVPKVASAAPRMALMIRSPGCR